MNKLFITGNLTGEPEVRTTTSGKTVCNFTVAVNRRKKIEGQPDADFFRVSAWESLGENCGKFLAKGRKVAVVGSVSVRTYDTQNGEHRAVMEIMAQDVEFMSPKSDTIDQQSGMEKVNVDLPY